MQIIYLMGVYYGLIRRNIGTDKPSLLKASSREALLNLMFLNV